MLAFGTKYGVGGTEDQRRTFPTDKVINFPAPLPKAVFKKKKIRYNNSIIPYNILQNALKAFILSYQRAPSALQINGLFHQ